MDDAVGMRFAHGFARLEQEVGGLLGGKRAALLEDRGEVAPGEAFHHDERQPVDGVDIVDLRDVRVLDAHAGAGFLLEAGDGLGIVTEAGARELDGDVHA